MVTRDDMAAKDEGEAGCVGQEVVIKKLCNNERAR
jgi:hypothetical protein